MNELLPPLGTDTEQERAVTYVWPGGEMVGAYQPLSAERPHLRWEFRNPPPVWRMSPDVTVASIETIPGDPTHTTAALADQELELIASRGGGQPYLVIVKLHGEPYRFHLRAYLDGPHSALAFADLREMTPPAVQELARPTGKLLGYRVFDEDERPLFDPDRYRGAWLTHAGLALTSDWVAGPGNPLDDDFLAEAATYDAAEVAAFEEQVAEGDFSVPDSVSTVKTRGSAQRHFAAKVKAAYGNRCALTGISTSDFLVASHIVPWSTDESIRLDPSNGICLSLMVDRAFEGGYLLIEDDFSVRLNRERIGSDEALLAQLERFDGITMRSPSHDLPKREYLQRRRALFE